MSAKTFDALPTLNAELLSTFSSLADECSGAGHIVMSAVPMLQCSSQGTPRMYAVEMIMYDFLGGLYLTCCIFLWELSE